MERIKVEKNTDYTVISNIFLKDESLSLKCKGFLAVVMSLPDSWDFSIGGMAAICKEGKSAIYSSIKELIQFGYCKRTYLYDDVKKDGKVMKLRVGVVYAIAEKPTYLDLDKLNKDTLNQEKLNLDKRNDNNKVNTKSSTYSNKVNNELSKESVVTDTPPLQTNLTEIPTGSEKTESERLDVEISNFLKEKSTEKKPNSGGGAAQNSQPNVSNSNKPKKAVREWFKLASLTEEQKDKIRKLSREFDSPAVFGDSLRQWLEYKEAGEINFRNQKINPYKNFETMLKEVTSEANKCKGQSDVFKQAVQHSIDKLYLGLFPEKFITQTQPVKNGNYNKQQQGNVQPTIIFKTGC